MTSTHSPVASGAALGMEPRDTVAPRERALCPGCGAPATGRFCAACGEETVVEDLSLRALIAGIVEHLTALDVKLLRTVRLLLFRPGQLTVEYRRGVRKRYTRPLPLFLLVLGAFFVAMANIFGARDSQAELANTTLLRSLQPRVAAMQRQSGETPPQFFARYDRRAEDVKRGLLALFVPALSLMLALLYARRRRYTIEHVVFATHYFTFSLLLVAIWFALVKGSGALAGLYVRLIHGGHQPSSPVMRGLVVGSLLVLGFLAAGYYLWAALRRTYDSGRWGAGWRTAVIVFALAIAGGFYPRLLANLTLALM